MSGPFILVPLGVTDAMVASSTIAEPDATQGEVVWAAGTNYTLGQKAILTTTHRVYENLIPGIDATSPDVAVMQTTPRWLDLGPTNKWAAYDSQISTQSKGIATLTYVLRPGFFNAISIYGLEGATVTITAKLAPGGAAYYGPRVFELIEPPLDYYDYYFGVIRSSTKLLVRDLDPQAAPELTITITAGAGAPVKVGMIAIGDLRELVTAGLLGGTQYGAKVTPITYSYINTDQFGVTTIKRRGSATNMDITARLPQTDADAALLTVQEVLDQPVAVIGTDAFGYAGLNCFGLVTGSLSYDGPNHANLNVQVKGLL